MQSKSVYFTFSTPYLQDPLNLLHFRGSGAHKCTQCHVFSVNLMSIVLLQDINLGQLAEEVSRTILGGGELPSTRDVAEQVSHVCGVVYDVP